MYLEAESEVHSSQMCMKLESLVLLFWLYSDHEMEDERSSALTYCRYINVKELSDNAL